MQEWQPGPPVDSSFYNETNYKEFPILLSASNQQLIEKIEQRFNPISLLDLIEDVANWIDIWRRKKIRSNKGEGVTKFNNSNSYLQSIGGRTGYHLFQINQVVCSDLSIQNYLQSSIKMSLTEQILRTNVLLIFNNKITSLHFGNRGATLATAVLMCRLGLDKFWLCE